jgi:hypothetical protein
MIRENNKNKLLKILVSKRSVLVDFRSRILINENFNFFDND